jgi:hypothetical protein
LAEGIRSTWRHRAARTRIVTRKPSPACDHVVDIGLAQLLDDPAGLEGVHLGRVLLGHSDLGEQRGVGFCRVRDRRFGDAPPQLLHDDLALLLAVDPLLVSRKSHADGFTPSGVRRWMVMDCFASNIRRSFLLADPIHAAFRHGRNDAVGLIPHRQALNRNRDDAVRLADLRGRKETLCQVSSSELFES